MNGDLPGDNRLGLSDVLYIMKDIAKENSKNKSPFTYVPARCRGEPYVRPRTNNAFVPTYDGRTQGSPLHVLGT